MCIKTETEDKINRLFTYKNFDKYETYRQIKKERSLSDYIPFVEKVQNTTQIIKLVKQYEKVILKSMNFFESRPSLMLEIIDGVFKITSNTVDKSIDELFVCEEELKEFLISNKAFFTGYIIQRYIQLTRIGQLSYDIRVSMERKERENRWICKAVQCCIGKNKFLLSRKQCSTKDTAFKKFIKNSFPVGLTYEQAIKEIEFLCVSACKVMHKYNHLMNEGEFYIGIDEGRKMWILDIKMAHNMKIIKQLDYAIYCSQKYTSIIYAASLDMFQNN